MEAKVCRRWTQDEKDYVEDKWGVLSISRIAKRIGRSYTSIQRYAERNNLGGSCFNTMYYTTVQVANMLGVDQKTIIRYVQVGELKADSRKIQGRKVYLIPIEEFDKFKETFKPKNYNVWTTLQEKQLVELVKEGKTSKEIALIMGKSVKSIRGKRVRLMRKERE